MVFGMSTACFFPDVYTEDAIDLMGKMHIENIEIFFSCMSEYQTPFIADLKKRAANNGIRIYSVHAFSVQFEAQLFSRHPRARQESLDIYSRVLEAGAALGAGVYVFHGPANIKRTGRLALDFPYIAERTEELAGMAKDYGIKLAWENVHWCWYAGPGFAAELLRHVRTDNLFFTLDIKQAAQAGYDPADFLTDTRGRLANVHVCDYTHSEERGIVPTLPFHGEMDFGAFKKSLAAFGYDQALILEVYSSNYTDHAQLFDNFERVRTFFSG